MSHFDCDPFFLSVDMAFAASAHKNSSTTARHSLIHIVRITHRSTTAIASLRTSVEWILFWSSSGRMTNDGNWYVRGGTSNAIKCIYFIPIAPSHIKRQIILFFFCSTEREEKHRINTTMEEDYEPYGSIKGLNMRAHIQKSKNYCESRVVERLKWERSGKGNKNTQTNEITMLEN